MSGLPTVGQALAHARTRLQANFDADEAWLSAQLLLADLLHQNRTYLLAWPERTLSTQQAILLQQRLERRIAGEPLAYILGHKEFWSLKLRVTPAVLIPRPETETLVSAVLELLPKLPAGPVADLGTGSGAIAAALASEHTTHPILATDRSAAALDVARANFSALGLNIDTCLGDWFSALPAGTGFAALLSNPPYIAPGDPHLPALRHEPLQALQSRHQGFADLETIVAGAPDWLLPGGWLLLEHGQDQASRLGSRLRDRGFQHITTWTDLSGQERVSGGCWQHSGT